ncbi:LysR family transcriptional regulator [Rhizobium sp. G21]|uniref:LysR family transcriptional regulator n=1 Tax=Rhizobium sp. G21 TaxID=2758439 RepID=UPI0028AED63E|nr:LysR family transcriptional regulator [Rhizobium sp. G21]
MCWCRKCASSRCSSRPDAMDPFRLGLVATRIHYFQLVARLGSIRRAALALNVAPSSISRVLKQLEDELGTPLFERVRQRLKLTSAGELMLYHARASLGELNRACNEINELHGLHRGSLSVAVVESVARGLMPGRCSSSGDGIRTSPSKSR